MSEVVNGEIQVGSGQEVDPAEAALAILERDNPEPAQGENHVADSAEMGDSAEASGTGPGAGMVATDTAGLSGDTEEAPPPVETPRDEAGKFKKLTAKERKEQIQAEMNRATYLRHEEERRLEEIRLQRAQLEAETERLRQPKQAAPEGNGKSGDRPDWYKSFERFRELNPTADYEDWSDARAELRAQQIVQAERARWEQSQQQTLQRQRDEQTYQAHFQRIAAAKAKYPDWQAAFEKGQQAIGAAGVPEIPPVLVHAFLQSEAGPDILYYLGTHPDELVRLTLENLRTPVEAAPLMRQYLEARLAASTSSGPAKTPISSLAKPPIQPLGSAPVTASVSPDELEFGPEYVRAVTKELRSRR